MYYRDPPDPAVYYQGDVLADLPIILLPEQLLVLRDPHGPPIPPSQLADAFKADEQVIVAAHRTHALIISQTCDIQNREFVSVCPVFPITRLERLGTIERVRRNQVLYRFHLPAYGDVEESYADFSIINSVRPATIRVAKRLLSLTDLYRQHLGHQLSLFFSRPFLP